MNSLTQDPTAEMRQVLIVRLWRESRDSSDDPPLWRGVIRGVSSTDVHYFQSIEELNRIVADKLRTMGVDPHQSFTS